MSDDPIVTFLQASTLGRLRLARDAAWRPVLKEYFGAAAMDEYDALAARVAGEHLSVAHAVNLIFVPGVMGSLLHSRTKGGVWWIDVRTRAHLDDLRLSADGAQDADANNDVAPFSSDPAYEPFLTAVLGRDDFGHEVCPYDWRKTLTHSVPAFRNLVGRMYEANGCKPVHVVAHSMGGLLVRSALRLHGDELWPRIGRIVFIGTPHYGSAAIAGYLKNHLWGFELLTLLGRYLTRGTFRSLRGVLSLLPSPRGAYPGTREDEELWTSDEADPYVHPCANFDLYDAQSWRLDLEPGEDSALQSALDEGAALHCQLHEWHGGLTQEQRDRMLIIAGVGVKTLFRLAYTPRFFGVWDRMTKVTERTPGDLHREGDGRVPLASASLENVAIRYVRGVHGSLPNIPAVYADVFRWLNRERLALPETPAAAVSGHLAADSAVSDAPTLDGSAAVSPFDDDAGLWRMEEPTPERLAALDGQLEDGQLPEFVRIRVF